MVKDAALDSTQKMFSLKNISSREVRLGILLLLFVLFQLSIFIQLPFIQYHYILNFYAVSGLIFLHHLYLNTQKNQNTFVSFAFDLGLLFYLTGQHPSLTSFNLIAILLTLFIAGIELQKEKTFWLVSFCSVALSVINLFFIKWEGVQNLFSLALFNFTFILVGIFSQQFKEQITSLQSEIATVTTQLRSQEEFAQVLIQELPTGLMALNTKKEVMYFNKQLEQKLNLKSEDLIALAQLLNSQAEQEVSFYNKNTQAQKIYEIHQAFYNDSYLQEKIQLLTIADKTEIKHLQEQMRQKEKLAAIGQLAAGIAHEIRNPLAGISGSIQLLSSETQNPDDQKLMKIILKEIDRLNHLITEFLDYSKPEKRPDQKIDLAVVMNEVLQNVKLALPVQSKVVVESDLQTVHILGFSDKLKQAFLNITMNAVQAMNESLVATLKVKLFAENNLAVLIIADTGKGMTEEVKKRIFEPFFTTKPKGTGLGLAITHKVLEAHEAQLQISSELGHGTEFILKFKLI